MNEVLPPRSTDALVDLVRDVPRLWRSLIDRRLRPLGLTQAKWRVLVYAARQKHPVSQTELAEVLGIETPTLVRLLDRLSAAGWVRRKPCPNDRRIRRVELTRKALLVSNQIDATVRAVREELFAGLSADELDQCEATLRHIRDAAERALAAPDQPLP